jgi:hypothetical protein
MKLANNIAMMMALKPSLYQLIFGLGQQMMCPKLAIIPAILGMRVLVFTFKWGAALKHFTHGNQEHALLKRI